MSAQPYDDDLLDALAPDGAPVEADDDTPWQVTDLGSADWASRKARQARRKIAEAKAERDRIVAAADEWLERQTREHARAAEWFEGRLIEWLRRELEDDPKGKKSRELPSGAVVKRTSGRERLVVEDERAVGEWLSSQEDTHDLVEWVPKFSRSEVKKLVLSTGEVPPGARLERGEDSYKVELGGAS